MITVTAESLPEAWEEAVILCWQDGRPMPTQYDKPGDPPSRDCAAVIEILNPLAEPRIHRAFPGSLEDLWKYRQEVVKGVHDHWIDPAAGKWSYTYHKRFTAYPTHTPAEGLMVTRQLEAILQLLTDAPHTRRAQAITWVPATDLRDEHCPCVQRIWFRVDDERLNMHLHIRSNDAYKAGFMNMFAFIELQRHMAEQLSLRLHREISVGVYRHFADSWHIYGSYFQEFDGFLRTLRKRKWADRVWRSDDEIVQQCFTAADIELTQEQNPND